MSTTHCGVSFQLCELVTMVLESCLRTRCCSIASHTQSPAEG